jgi:hypothetical protein
MRTQKNSKVGTVPDSGPDANCIVYSLIQDLGNRMGFYEVLKSMNIKTRREMAAEWRAWTKGMLEVFQRSPPKPQPANKTPFRRSSSRARISDIRTRELPRLLSRPQYASQLRKLGIQYPQA